MALNNNDYKNAARFAGIGIQMIVIIGICATAGYFLDLKTNHTNHLFAALFSLLGVVAAIWLIIREVTGDK